MRNCFEFIHKNTAAVLFLAVIWCVTGTVSAQNTGNEKLSGTIIGSDKAPIEMATVILNNRIVSYTDKEGKFSFTGLKAGEYDYAVACLGYQTAQGKITIPAKDKFTVTLKALSIGLDEVEVTAKSVAMGSTSRISETAIQHIQPKSVDDMLQLLPGNLTSNPSINKLGQAYIREIDNSNANNALGTAIMVDGAPLSNDGNLQSFNGSVSSSSGQATAGRGVDTRILSPDNVESMEVIRGIPSVEYGNLTSGVVIVKTKSGETPFEVKFKADPFSKMLYAGKGFGLKRGGAVNFGIDWSQSYDDPRKRYLGFDRVTGTLGYSNRFNVAGKQFSLNAKGSFYSNVNKSRKDVQMEEYDGTYTNNNIGLRFNLETSWKLDSWLVSSLDFNGMVSWAHQKDEYNTYVYTSRNVSTNTTQAGESEASFIPASYFTDYYIDGKPLNIYLLLKANRNIEFGENDYTQIKVGADWRYDDNNGEGTVFDPLLPPSSSSDAQSMRPRAYKDIPAMNNLGIFIEDKTQAHLGTTILTAQVGVRLTNMFLDKAEAKRDNIFVAEPRFNGSYQLLNHDNNGLFRDLSITGGAGISYKLPTLLYLYPDKTYWDYASLIRKNNDNPADQLALITTHVIPNRQNPDLKPAKSFKWEIGTSFDLGKHFSGVVTFFKEEHTDEFGFQSFPYYGKYKTYDIPSDATNLRYENENVIYTDASGAEQTASYQENGRFETYSTPANRTRTDKKGIEFALNFGQIRPLRTSLIVDGAWFNIKRTTPGSYAAVASTSITYPYIKNMPGGSGSVQDRINTNFRFITHIPKIKLVFSTTVQVVWYERRQNIWKDESGNNRFKVDASTGNLIVEPLGYWDKTLDNLNPGTSYVAWDPSFSQDVVKRQMVSSDLSTAYSNEIYKPWVMLNFRLTKEIGSWLDLSFTANNFTSSSKYHRNYTSTQYSQIYSNLYFGAELRIKIDNIKLKRNK